jgi:hypothetical protein
MYEERGVRIGKRADEGIETRPKPQNEEERNGGKDVKQEIDERRRYTPDKLMLSK